eukprot:631756-Pelagomonas_calceolata.AAC.3
MVKYDENGAANRQHLLVAGSGKRKAKVGRRDAGPRGRQQQTGSGKKVNKVGEMRACVQGRQKKTKVGEQRWDEVHAHMAGTGKEKTKAGGRDACAH